MTASWGPPAPPGSWAPPLPDHPRGTTVLVLGILSLTVWVTAPFAWVLGSKAKREIAASGQHWGNERDLEIGRILGMVLTLVGVAFAVVYAGLIVAMFAVFRRLATF